MNKDPLSGLKLRLDQVSKDLHNPADEHVRESIREAIAAAEEGNFGVGCVLVKNNQIIERGHNQVFLPYFRSDLHAEMVSLNRLEDRQLSTDSLKGLTLYSSLEPCPMCTIRIVNSGINYVFYAAEDEQGGMLRRLNDLPVEFQNLARNRVLAQAECSEELQAIAWQVFALTVEQGDQRLEARRDALGRVVGYQ
jgi:tRNA(Arg) A34 adenosine deaminase TadA